MAISIATGPVEPCTLEECQAALEESGFEPADPASVGHAARWLARLAANRTFLGDMALAELQRGCRRVGGQGYSPQVMMLGAARPGWFMRANIWPSPQESMLHSSGEEAFVYGLAHDHNFDFLTVGYHGPGYASDHYEVDPETVTGKVGERVDLDFKGRAVLTPGTVMHYRARRDVHCQYPPESLSVSLNLMHSAAAQRWTDQFQYDLDTGTILRVLTGCNGDTLARLALMLAPGDSRPLLESMASDHHLPRLRWSAIRALALAEPAREDRIALLERQMWRSSGWLTRRCLAAISD